MTPTERHLYTLISWLFVALVIVAVWLLGTTAGAADPRPPLVSETVRVGW